MSDLTSVYVVSGLVVLVVVLVLYLVWSYRPPRPDLVEYQYKGTACTIQWSCSQDQEQYRCHLLPPAIAQLLPLKHFLIDVKVRLGKCDCISSVSKGNFLILNRKI